MTASLALIALERDQVADWEVCLALVAQRRVHGRATVGVATVEDALVQCGMSSDCDRGALLLMSPRPAHATRAGAAAFDDWLDCSAADAIGGTLADGVFTELHQTPSFTAASTHRAFMALELSREVFVVLANCPVSMLDALLQACEVSGTERWRCRDAVEASVRGERMHSMRMTLGQREVRGSNRTLRVFHGSAMPIGELGATVGSSSERALWVSPSRAFAGSFGIESVRDGRLIHGVDLLTAQPAIVVAGEAVGIARVQAISQVALTELDVCSEALVRAGDCDGYEFRVEGEAARVVRVVEIDGAWLCANGMRPEQFEVSARGMFGALKMCDADWLAHFGFDRATVESTPFLRRAATAWLPDWLRIAPNRVSGYEPSEALRMVRRVLLPEIARRVQWPTVDGHDERHAWLVAHIAMLIALDIHEPPLAPVVAAALHDTARCDDEEDSRHGATAARLANTVVCSLRAVPFPQRVVPEICEAIRSHSEVGDAPSPIAAVLRDADRLGLAWERGYDGKYFSTE